MRKLFSVGVLFLTVILFLDNGNTLNCYQCRTDKDEGCKAPFNQNFSQPCTKKSPAHCRKIHQKLNFKGQKSYYSIRECAYEKEQKSGCYYFKWFSVANMETCECSEDNCNSGSSHIPSLIPVAFPLILIFTHLKPNNS